MNLLRIAARVAARYAGLDQPTVGQAAQEHEGMDNVGEMLSRIEKAVSKWRAKGPSAGDTDSMGGDTRYYLRADEDGWKLMFIHPEQDQVVYHENAAAFDPAAAAKAASAHWSSPVQE